MEEAVRRKGSASDKGSKFMEFPWSSVQDAHLMGRRGRLRFISRRDDGRSTLEAPTVRRGKKNMRRKRLSWRTEAQFGHQRVPAEGHFDLSKDHKVVHRHIPRLSRFCL
mmetsp:Transcript_25538/g.58919  ORF Transcript_25538/g.58919 Transcript_25538/m.58919 type:complete len:109 (-) Transcript_25538:473-799(-)